jgi:hypothetical protein
MLALSAAIIYLTLPIVLLFGFFMFTESIATRLMMRFLTIILNTIILNGLIALFLLLLINVSVNGSLSAYLGLVGVAVIGGFILARVAAGTLKETLSMAMSAVGGIWMGATTAVMGKEAAAPARSMLGVAKVGAAAAVLGAAGAGALDLAEGGLHTARSGVRDLERTNPDSVDYARKQTGHLPAPLAKMAQQGLDTRSVGAAEPETMTTVSPLSSTLKTTPVAASASSNGAGQPAVAGMATGVGMAAISPLGGRDGETGRNDQAQQGMSETADQERPGEGHVIDRYSQDERLAVWQTGQRVGREEEAGHLRNADGTLTAAGVQAVSEQLDERQARVFATPQGQRDLTALVAAQDTDPRARGWGVPEARQGQVDTWFQQTYQAQETGRDGQQVSDRENARDLFGEQLARDGERVVARRPQNETEPVLQAVRESAAEMPPQSLLDSQGRLTGEGLRTVETNLDEQTRQAFAGSQGQRDLATLTAMTLQREVTAEPAQYRQAVAAAQPGDGERAPGRTVPRELGLDPVAAGAHFSGLNQFAQVSEQAGLSAEQRQQLLAEVKQEGQVSPELREEIQTSLDRQTGRGHASGLGVDDVIAGAQALPDTLSGPLDIRLPADAPVGERVAAELRRPETETTTPSGSPPSTMPVVTEPASVPTAGGTTTVVDGQQLEQTVAAGSTAAVVAGSAAAAATVADEVRGRLAAQQQQDEAGRSEVVAELRAQAATTPQPVAVVGGDGSVEPTSPATPSGVTVDKYEAHPQVEAPLSRGSGDDEEFVMPVTSLPAPDNILGEHDRDHRDDQAGDESASVAAALRHPVGDEEGSEEESPDLRAEALKQMAKEAQEREAAAEQSQPATDEQGKDEPIVNSEVPLKMDGDSRTDTEIPTPQEMAASGTVTPPTQPDAADEARNLAAELRNQVKAKAGADEVAAEPVTVREAASPAPGEKQAPEADKSPQVIEGAKERAAAETRSKLVQTQQQVDPAAAGAGGIAAELRRGRVDEAAQPAAKTKKKTQVGDSEKVTETLSAEQGTDASASEASAVPENSAVPDKSSQTGSPTGTSLMPHHRHTVETAEAETKKKAGERKRASKPKGRETSAAEPADQPANTKTKQDDLTSGPSPATPSTTVEPQVSAQPGRAGSQPVPESLVGSRPAPTGGKKPASRRTPLSRRATGDIDSKNKDKDKPAQRPPRQR